MSDAQLGEFRSRMERIQKDRPDPARVLRRDSYGLIVETVETRKTKKSFKLISVLRTLVMLFVAFTIFKAVLIHNSDRIWYDKILDDLKAGDAKSQLIAKAIGPDYFTKPVGTFIADITGQIVRISKK